MLRLGSVAGLAIRLFIPALLLIQLVLYVNIRLESREPWKETILGESISPSNDDADLKVGLCAFTKDAERYLDEWIDYNFAIGFHAIYLYDNSNEDELKEWGEFSRKAGRNVVVIPYNGTDGTYIQRDAYDECAETFGNQSHYLAFFDDDEFLVLKKHKDVSGLVRDHLPNGSLSIHWRIFGTANHSLYSPLPVTKRFQYRMKTHHNVKSIARSRDYEYARTQHSFETSPLTFQRDTSGASDFSPTGASSTRKTDDVAVLHHYKYKSEKEYSWKSCIRGRGYEDFTGCDEQPPSGDVFDDLAWQILKHRVPKYAMFDEWADLF